MTGKKLKEKLGLQKFDNILIQKIINFPRDLFLVYVDSRMPNRTIPFSDIRSGLNCFVIKELQDFGKGDSFSKTAPISLTDYKGALRDNGVYIVIDLAGERFGNSRMFNKR